MRMGSGGALTSLRLVVDLLVGVGLGVASVDWLSWPVMTVICAADGTAAAVVTDWLSRLGRTTRE
jgi:hypothetical protein